MLDVPPPFFDSQPAQNAKGREISCGGQRYGILGGQAGEKSIVVYQTAHPVFSWGSTVRYETFRGTDPFCVGTLASDGTSASNPCQARKGYSLSVDPVLERPEPFDGCQNHVAAAEIGVLVRRGGASRGAGKDDIARAQRDQVRQ